MKDHRRVFPLAASGSDIHQFYPKSTSPNSEIKTQPEKMESCY